MSNEQSTLPCGWAMAPLGTLGNFINGRGFKKSEWSDKGLPIIRIQNLTGSGESFNRYSGPLEEKHRVNPGDLLVSWSATLDAYIWNGPTSALNQHIYKVEPFIDKLYLFYCIKAYLVRLVEQIHGTGMQHITKGRFMNTMVPVAPLPEQRRIVAKVEALLAESKTAREALDKVPVLLRRFRQSVLAKAFRGELTQRDPNDEPAQKLLERIRQERNKRKQTSLTDNQKEPPADLPKLPETWVWTNVGHISENYDGKRIPVKDKDREKMKGDLPYYGASGIIDYVNDYIFDGEYLLISEDGANLLSRSTPIAFIAKGKFWVNNHAHVVKTCGQIPLAYVEAYFNSISLAKWVTGTAQPKLTQGKMNTIPIPLAPLEEQKRIVAKIQELFSLADGIETAVKKAKQRADRIDQAILAKAFRGELVPQNPNDEPASVLLQRLKSKVKQQSTIQTELAN